MDNACDTRCFVGMKTCRHVKLGSIWQWICPTPCPCLEYNAGAELTFPTAANSVGGFSLLFGGELSRKLAPGNPPRSRSLQPPHAGGADEAGRKRRQLLHRASTTARGGRHIPVPTCGRCAGTCPALAAPAGERAAAATCTAPQPQPPTPPPTPTRSSLRYQHSTASPERLAIEPPGDN